MDSEDPYRPPAEENTAIEPVVVRRVLAIIRLFAIMLLISLVGVLVVLALFAGFWVGMP